MSDDFNMFNDDFGDVDLLENSEPRCAVCLVLDCSDSMTQTFPGETRSAMEALNGGLDTLVAEVYKDPLARKRIELSFVPYGGEIGEPTPFSTVENIVVPSLAPMGITNTGAALTKALDALEERKKAYKSAGTAYYAPMMFLISDGLSMDDLKPASDRIKALEGSRKLSFFAIGVEGADLPQLGTIGTRQALGLKGLNFAELFEWISQSVSNVSASQVGSDDKIALPSPAGWAEI